MGVTQKHMLIYTRKLVVQIRAVSKNRTGEQVRAFIGPGVAHTSSYFNQLLQNKPQHKIQNRDTQCPGVVTTLAQSQGKDLSSSEWLRGGSSFALAGIS